MSQAKGVLPDSVIRDHRAEGLFVFATLRSDIDRAGVVAWLERITELVHDITRPVHGERASRVAVGLGPSFFANGRFEISPENVPAGMQAPASLPGLTDPAAGQADALFYLMVTSEAVAARFLEGLAATRPDLARMSIERGYQRDQGREPGGFRDGLRNLSRANRSDLVFVDRDELPEEPAWSEDGTYLAYLKIAQDLDAWKRLPTDQQEQIIGRRKSDGSRLDLPSGTNPREEGPVTADPPSPNSHVRKAGPRSELHDRTGIFRRGIPFFGIRESDGTLEEGLHFVSFQRSLDAFTTILARWMLNPAFPQPNTAVDRLFSEGLTTMLKGGVYFVPPHHDERFIAAGLFDPPPERRRPRRGTGRAAIRKRVVDPSGAPVQAELGGAGFQVFRQDTNASVGDVFFTDSVGHALSGDLPVDVPLLIREVQPPPGQQADGDQPVTIAHRRELVRFSNRVSQPSPGYSG
jgi:Dyp-type peroxidase family